jgi:hypothetical protein
MYLPDPGFELGTHGVIVQRLSRAATMGVNTDHLLPKSTKVGYYKTINRLHYRLKRVEYVNVTSLLQTKHTLPNRAPQIGRMRLFSLKKTSAVPINKLHASRATNRRCQDAYKHLLVIPILARRSPYPNIYTFRRLCATVAR